MTSSDLFETVNCVVKSFCCFFFVLLSLSKRIIVLWKGSFRHTCLTYFIKGLLGVKHIQIMSEMLFVIV